jgi:putative RNA 2'-phosphotransferase
MDDRRMVKISKYLARHLRHDPGRLGLQLEPGGWIGVDALLKATNERGMPFTISELSEVVERNDKQRYEFDASRSKIRASQGHSIDVDLGLAPAVPPTILFHGTATRSLDAIWRYGLLPMGRRHVHLSGDVPTAVRVGARHGKPVVLAIDAARLADEGHAFWLSANHVWLSDPIAPAYLSLAPFEPPDRASG